MVMHSWQAEQTWIYVHENETQSPWKKLEGRPICRSLHKKSEFLAPAKLGCVLAFLENAIIIIIIII